MEELYLETYHSLTGLLEQWNQGEADVLDEIYPLIYESLRKMARQSLRSWNTNIDVRATELVNEIYIQLKLKPFGKCKDKQQFLKTIGQLMRWILYDYHRSKEAKKNGGHLNRSFPENGLDTILDNSNLLANHYLSFIQAMDALAQVSKQQAEVINLVFLGYKQKEIAEHMNISQAQVSSLLQNGRIYLRLNFKKTKK